MSFGRRPTARVFATAAADLPKRKGRCFALALQVNHSSNPRTRALRLCRGYLGSAMVSTFHIPRDRSAHEILENKSNVASSDFSKPAQKRWIPQLAERVASASRVSSIATTFSSRFARNPMVMTRRIHLREVEADVSEAVVSHASPVPLRTFGAGKNAFSAGMLRTSISGSTCIAP